MSKQSVQLSETVNNNPQAVIAFVADIRNRAKYLQSLKGVTDIQGEPGEVGASWRWKWDFSDHEFEGVGRCVEYEAGSKYSFVTEGDIVSQFTYQAEAAGTGTNLSITVEFEVPAALAGQPGLEGLLASAKERGQQAVKNLKAMLEK